MLSITSMALKSGIEGDLSVFLGSIAGAMSVQTLGNKISIEKDAYIRNLEYILNV